jgi:hypothetical protein
MTLKSGIVEFIWGVWEGNVARIELSGPWGVLANNVGYDTPIRKPIFRSYDDLKSILKNAFGIYEDFKIELHKSSMA